MMKRLVLCGIIVSAVIGFIGMNAIMSSTENVPVFTQDQLQSANIVVNAGDVFVVKAPANSTVTYNNKRLMNLAFWNKSNSFYGLYRSNDSLNIADVVQVKS